MKEFIKRQNFKIAKSMPEYPHSYIVKDNLNDEDKKKFEEIVMFIRKEGKEYLFTTVSPDGKSCTRPYIYYLHDGYYYWTMGDPLDQTIILNRADETKYKIFGNEMKYIGG